MAEAIAAAIVTPEAVDTLTAINERLILPRVGMSIVREMNRDITTLRASASLLAVLLAGGRKDQQ